MGLLCCIFLVFFWLFLCFFPRASSYLMADFLNYTLLQLWLFKCVHFIYVLSVSNLFDLVFLLFPAIPTSVSDKTVIETLEPWLLLTGYFLYSPHVTNCKLSTHLYFKPHLLGTLYFSLSCYYGSLSSFLLLCYLLLLFAHTSQPSFPWLSFLQQDLCPCAFVPSISVQLHSLFLIEILTLWVSS